MIIILYLAVVGLGLYWASKMLLPEMIKPSLPKAEVVQTKPKETSPSEIPVNRMERLETLLEEKNKNINLLQKELQIFHIQVRDFDKIKTLLEDEVHRLREQNRMFRSELGLPTSGSKEKSLI